MFPKIVKIGHLFLFIAALITNKHVAKQVIAAARRSPEAEILRFYKNTQTFNLKKC